MNVTAERLELAAKLIEKGWCQGHGAEDAEGNPVHSNSPDAARVCLEIAIERAATAIPDVVPTGECDMWLAKVVPAFDWLPHMDPFSSRLSIANDQPDTTQADVLRWLREAAHMARSEEALYRLRLAGVER